MVVAYFSFAQCNNCEMAHKSNEMWISIAFNVNYICPKKQTACLCWVGKFRQDNQQTTVMKKCALCDLLPMWAWTSWTSCESLTILSLYHFCPVTLNSSIDFVQWTYFFLSMIAFNLCSFVPNSFSRQWLLSMICSVPPKQQQRIAMTKFWLCS